MGEGTEMIEIVEVDETTGIGMIETTMTTTDIPLAAATVEDSEDLQEGMGLAPCHSL